MIQPKSSTAKPTGLGSLHLPLERFQWLCEDAELDAMTRMFATYRGVDIRLSTQSGGSVGRDFARFMPVANGNCITAAGHIRGNGPSLLGLKSLVEFKCDSLFRDLHSLEAVFASFNELVVATPGLGMVSLFAALGDLETGYLHYVCAGYNSPVVIHVPGDVEFLTGAAFPKLGFAPSQTYSRARCPITPGSTLLVFSNGLVRATNESGEEFGIDRLLQIAGEPYDRVDDMHRAIWRTVRNFKGTAPVSEDATLILLRF